MDNKYSHIGHDKKNFVQNMFDKISPKYDFFNHLTTFYIDKYWRNRFIKKLHIKKDATIVDIATGTGDIIIQICKNKVVNGVGLDCSKKMLEIANTKSKKKDISNLKFIHGYAEKLPFENDSIDMITISFGFRNFNDYETALNEIYRGLKPEGKLAVLEFCRPKNSLFQKIFSFYFNKIIPIIGKILTGEKIFDYLPESVNNFFSASELKEKLNTYKFNNIIKQDLTFGICSILVGQKINVKNR